MDKSPPNWWRLLFYNYGKACYQDGMQVMERVNES